MSEGYTVEYVKNMGPAAATTAMNALSNARIKESNRALAYERRLKSIRASCASILHDEGNTPGYELREFCEYIHGEIEGCLKKP